MKRLDEVFNVWYGVNLELVNCFEDKHGIPFVSRTANNNGIVTRIKEIPNIDPNPANTISIACGGSVLSTFFIPTRIIADVMYIFLNRKKK